MKIPRFIFAIAVLQFFSSFLLPFVYWPEMLNWPFILSRGWLPYRDFTIVHTPLLPYVLALIYTIFGFTPWILRVFAALVLATNTGIFSLILYRLTTKRSITLLLAGFFVFLTFTFEGNTLWFESVLTTLFLLAYLLIIDFWDNPNSWKIWTLGIVFGMAFLVKQSSFFIFPVFAFPLFWFWRKRKLKSWDIGKFFLPIILLVSCFLIFLVSLGILDDFYHWAFEFVFLLPKLETPNLPPDLLLPSLRQATLIILMVGTAFYSAFRLRNFRGWTGLLFALFSILFIFPRFAYFHLLIFLPFFLLVVGQFIAKSNLKVNWLLPTALFFLTIPVFKSTFLLGDRFLDPGVQKAATWIKQNGRQSSIFSLNGPDLVYFLTQKTPAVRPWPDQLPWELNYFGEENFLAAFKQGNPDLVVFRPYLDQPVDGLGAYQPKLTVEYFFNHYSRVESFPDGTSIWARNK